MLRMKRIVVACDLEGAGVGPTAALAIEQARAIAARSGAHVTLFHSRRGGEHWSASANEYESLADRDTSEAKRILEAAAGPLRSAGIACDAVVSDGPAGHALVQQVLREHADLVVLGKRERVPRDGRRMGSVSLNVVRHAPCLVSVLQPEAKPLPGLIVAATDGGPVGARVVRVAASLAAICGGTLHVIHALSIDLETQLQGAEEEQVYVERRCRELRAEVDAQAKEGGYEGRVQLHAGVTTPTRAVREAVSRLQPDAVVMGTISRGGVPGLLVGNTAERLLGTLDCSLIVAKPDDFVSPVTLD